MHTELQEKVLVLKQPTAIVNNSAHTINVIDTQGYDYCVIEVYLGATDIGITVMKVQESDVKASATALTGGVDVPGCVFGTSNQDTGVVSVLPSGTSDNSVYQFAIDLRGGRKRYLLPLVTIDNGVAGGFVVVTARLSRAKESGRLASEVGVAQRLLA